MTVDPWGIDWVVTVRATTRVNDEWMKFQVSHMLNQWEIDRFNAPGDPQHSKEATAGRILAPMIREVQDTIKDRT